MRVVNVIALILVIIGALNWGSVGFFHRDFITPLLGGPAARVVFAIVGLAGLWSLSFFRHLCYCKTKDRK